MAARLAEISLRESRCPAYSFSIMCRASMSSSIVRMVPMSDLMASCSSFSLLPFVEIMPSRNVASMSCSQVGQLELSSKNLSSFLTLFLFFCKSLNISSACFFFDSNGVFLELMDASRSSHFASKALSFFSPTPTSTCAFLRLICFFFNSSSRSFFDALILDSWSVFFSSTSSIRELVSLMSVLSSDNFPFSKTFISEKISMSKTSSTTLRLSAGVICMNES